MLQMGFFRSKKKLEQEIEQLQNKNKLMEQEINISGSEFEKLMKENASLKMALDEERKANQQSQQEFQMMRNLYDELSAFKGRLERAKRSVDTLLNTDEIDQLKRENVELFTKLKNNHSNWSVSIGKSNELKEYEKELKMQRSEIVNQAHLELDKVKRKMNDASIKFTDIMEVVLFEINVTLENSKRKLELIEQLPYKTKDSLTHEKIKNILLEQKNSMMREMMNLNLKQQNTSTFSLLRFGINDLIKSKYIKEEFSKNLNLPIDKYLSESIESNQNKIIIFHAAEDCDDKKKAQLILQMLTQLNINNINAYRLEIGKKPRPLVVVLESAKQATEILENEYSLKNTEFEGIKIFKFEEDVKNLSKNTKEDKSDPFCTSESNTSDLDECNEDDKPYRIVLYNVTEDDDDYKKGLSIVKELTSLPLKNIDVSRIGNKMDAKIRPMIISFDSQRYVNDAHKNWHLLKNTPFKGIRVAKHKELRKFAKRWQEC